MKTIATPQRVYTDINNCNAEIIALQTLVADDPAQENIDALNEKLSDLETLEAELATYGDTELTQEEIAQKQVDEAASIEQKLSAVLPDYRYQRENGGVIYMGKHIQTDRETRANWIGILINAQANPNYQVLWKTMDNSFVTYTAQQAIGAALTASAHVQKCFMAEAAVNYEQFETEQQIKDAFETAYQGA